MGVSDIILSFAIFVLCFTVNFEVANGEILTNATLQSFQTDKTLSNTTKSASIPDKILNAPVTPSGAVAEGGKVSRNNKTKDLDTTHMGREHTVEKPASVTVGSSTVAPQSSTKPWSIPAKEEPPFEIPEKNDNKKSVPKKGVELPVPTVNATNSSVIKSTSSPVKSSTSTTTTTTTTTTTEKPKRKKPTITEAGDELPPLDKSKNDDSLTKVPNFYINTDEKNTRQADYIVPIVAVILSVPLVAIIISVLYKRGSEWWQHRHYRRMDFLIEGMYNN